MTSPRPPAVPSAASTNEFGDFDGVILTVNRETVQALTARLGGVPADDPVRQLYGLAANYLEFFAEHANLLRSLFEHRMEDDRPYPDDILQMVMDAFALMHPPLVRLLPDADDVKIALLSRTLFSAVHGIHLARPRGAHGGRAAADCCGSRSNNLSTCISGSWHLAFALTRARRAQARAASRGRAATTTTSARPPST
ncbi:hypothetical protein ACU4GH_20335 [Bradyrhizobium betae]